jgi:phosphatidylglycerophosphate synthase
MLAGKLGHILDRPLGSIAKRIPFSPNSITLAGFILTAAASALLAVNLKWGAVIMLPAVFLDAVDGVVARAQGKVSRYGAFLDSVLDRYSDACIMLAVAWNLMSNGQTAGLYLALTALVGSLVTSYARARAEGLGVSCVNGLMERTERLILLFLGAVTGYMVIALAILAVLTNVTVIQRMLHVRRGLINN